MFADRKEVLRMNKNDVINYLKELPKDELVALKNYIHEKMGEDDNSGKKFMITRAWIGNREFGPSIRKTTTTSFSDMFDALFEEET